MVTTTTLDPLPRWTSRDGSRACARAFAGAGVDALLVTRLPNVRYLTGFTGSAGMVLVTPTDALLVTDGRYQEQSAEQIAASGADARIGVGTTQARQSEILPGGGARASAGSGSRRTG